ncbi:hypothetical protein HMPREF0519_2574, partial [Lentilactobacillus hilgardii DSM 20176 = ATCC 8290]
FIFFFLWLEPKGFEFDQSISKRFWIINNFANCWMKQANQLLPQRLLLVMTRQWILFVMLVSQ